MKFPAVLVALVSWFVVQRFAACGLPTELDRARATGASRDSGTACSFRWAEWLACNEGVSSGLLMFAPVIDEVNLGVLHVRGNQRLVCQPKVPIGTVISQRDTNSAIAPRATHTSVYDTSRYTPRMMVRIQATPSRSTHESSSRNPEDRRCRSIAVVACARPGEDPRDRPIGRAHRACQG